MPRNPAAKKNQHNARHENGLVVPGRRVTKQKSNGHLNGSAKPAASSDPIANLDLHNVPTPPVHSATASSLGAQPTLKKRYSESSVDGHDPDWEGVNGRALMSNYSGKPVMGKSRSSQDVSPVHIAQTILKSNSAGDTIALLIALLSLPHLVLTLVQFLFATLTIMPPGHGSPIAFLSFLDVFQGSAGSPAFATMLVLDIVCFGLWMCVWEWAQNFAIDLAQIQIAMTLGNGNSGKDGTVNAVCFVIVVLIHSIRNDWVRATLRTGVDWVIPHHIKQNGSYQNWWAHAPGETSFTHLSSSPSKFRSIFAIHILSQAFMAFVRRRVAGSQPGSSSKSARRTDTEASAGFPHALEPLNVDAANAATASGVDYHQPPTPGLRDLKDKFSNAKKRRRQAVQVRSRQPFWAALASTKVHVLREVEHSKGQPGAPTDTAGPTHVHADGTVWIANVEPSTISFEATYEDVSEHEQEPADNDHAKPFYVRINGARWHSVSLESGSGHAIDSGRYVGSISGLAPDCTYTCTFIRATNDEQFASITVKTPALAEGDIASTFVPTPARGSLRPSSPSTTLRTSIQTAEAKLNEARARLNKTKRAHKATITKVEKDIDKATSSLRSSSDDTKLRQKYLQAERSIQSTQEATTTIVLELENLQVIPEDQVADYDQKKSAYDQQNQMLNEANEALDTAKRTAKEELSCVNSEYTSIQSRKERLQARQAKLTEQHDRITEANAQGMNERERRAAESAAIETERQRAEQQLSETIQRSIHDYGVLQQRIQAQWLEIEALEKQAYSQREMMLNNAGPLTPEGLLPGERSPARPLGYGGYGPVHNPNVSAAMDPQASPFMVYANTLPNLRPRSNTNQSGGGNSNFSADFDDADPIPPMPSTTEFEPNGLNGRKGSGSSRGKNNGSPAGVIGDGKRGPQRGVNDHSPRQGSR